MIESTITISALITLVLTGLRIAYLAGGSAKALNSISLDHKELKNDVKDVRERVITVEADVNTMKRLVQEPMHAAK